ncbi:MAG TPA: YfhO family protein [Thermoanaerobaculia bacterium]|nr:YfhO family protein [Thermoanaerobaculia bacterium]
MPNLTWLYAGAVYAVAVALARRAGADLPRRIALLFFALVLVFFREPLTTDTINVPVDYYESLPPWANIIRHSHPSNPYINDVAMQLVPWAHAVREHWRAFELPLWEPTAASGYPLLANGQSQALSILRLLALPLSLGHAMTAEGAWKVLLALTFTFLFCRRRGYSIVASSIGAIGYGFSGFMLVWLHFGHATVAAMLPAALYIVDLLAERASAGRFVFASCIWGVILTGGHPETAATAGLLAVLFTGWITFIERPFGTRREAWHFVRASGGSVATGALLAAPFLIPFAEVVRKSQRFAALSGSPHPAGILADWASTIATLQPHFFGFVPHEQPWGPAIPEAITGFAGTFAVAGAIALFAHVAATRAWRSREAFILAALLISIGIIYGWPGVIDVFNLAFRLAPPARLRCLFALLTAVSAAAAVDLIERGFRRPVLIGLFGASLLLLTMMAFPFPTPAHRDVAVLALLPAVAVLAAATAATMLRWRGALLVLMLVIFAEHASVFGDWNAVLPASKLYPPTPLVRALVKLKSVAPPNAPFRIVGYSADFFPNLATMYGLEDIRAHDPMESFRYVGMLALCGGYKTADYFAMWPSTTTRLLDYLNVRYYVMGPGRTMDAPRFTMVYDGRDGRIFENHDVLPRFFATRRVTVEWDVKRFVAALAANDDWAHVAVLENLPITDDAMRADLTAAHAGPDASVTITSATSTGYSMHIVAPRHTLIASSIPWWPGWHVRADGKSIAPLRINGAFFGFLLTPGQHDIRVWYAPASFRIGLGISLATMLAMAFAVWRSRRQVPEK